MVKTERRAITACRYFNRTISVASDEQLFKKPRMPHVAHPNFLFEEFSVKVLINISCGVRFFDTTYLVLLYNNATCVTASPQCLQSSQNYIINDCTLFYKVQLICFKSLLDCRLYGELIVNVVPLVFKVFCIAEYFLLRNCALL